MSQRELRKDEGAGGSTPPCQLVKHIQGHMRKGFREPEHLFFACKWKSDECLNSILAIDQRKCSTVLRLDPLGIGRSRNIPSRLIVIAMELGCKEHVPEYESSSSESDLTRQLTTIREVTDGKPKTARTLKSLDIGLVVLWKG